MQIFRFGVLWSVLALVILRVVIGLHFYSEGLSKIRSGNFDATPFLAMARGPAAGFFHHLIDDYDGHIRLNVAPDPPLRIEPRRSIAIWEDWLESVKRKHGLDRDQSDAADQVLQSARTELLDYFAVNQVEMTGWLQGRQRLDGFARDGETSRKIAREVASIERQVAQIAATRNQTSAAWFASIAAIWDNFESGIRDLAPGQHIAPLPRPWAPAWSPIATINRCLPWFDLVVGVLLVLGLATRLAAGAALLLLAGIVATQPFWIPGTENTIYQWIEMAALFLILASGAGRFGGMDYFLTRSRGIASTAQAIHP